MEAPGGIKVQFIAGFDPIDRDVAESRKLYRDALGIPLKRRSRPQTSF